MERERISVVIPIYRAEKFLDQCIESLVKQSYPNLEIILVDDESPDRCPEICDQWAKRDSRIRVIHKENAGAGYARNTGIENASGAYICFFDSDDYLAEDAVEKAYHIAREENADIVSFGVTVVDQDGCPIRQVVPHGECLQFRGNDVQTVFLPDLIDGNHSKSVVNRLCFSLWSCMFSMDLLKRAEWKLVSEREYASEDSYSLLSLYKNVNSVVILPESLYFYRENQGSLSHSFRQDSNDRFKHFYRSCQFLAEQCGYSGEVHKRISGLFVSQEIGLMKQVALSGMPEREKVAYIKEIVSDEAIKKALAEIDWHYHSRARNILIWAIRFHLDFIVYCLVKLLVMRSNKRERTSNKK